MIPHVDLVHPVMKDTKPNELIDVIPLRSQRVHKLAIFNYYMIYLQEHEFDIID